MKTKFNHLKIAKNIAIVSFISISLLKLFYSLFYLNESPLIYIVRIISVFIYLLLGYFTYKDRLVPSIIMAVTLLLFGLWSIVEGVLIIKMTSVLRIAMIIVGSLFFLGGLSIISIIMKKNDKN